MRVRIDVYTLSDARRACAYHITHSTHRDGRLQIAHAHLDHAPHAAATATIAHKTYTRHTQQHIQYTCIFNSNAARTTN